jgi:carbonic anhydrase
MTKLIKEIFEENEKWRNSQIKKNHDFFKKSSKKQNPKILWIGCSDSRVIPNHITKLGLNKIFVHRNLGNLTLNNDLSFKTVLDYAINKLKIKNIIVCGHYNCGAIISAMENKNKSNKWFENILDVYNKNKKEVDSIKNIKMRMKKMVELNVETQVNNIVNSEIYKKSILKIEEIKVHSWVYNIDNGKIIDLNNN